ncbi:hypothetical protein PSDVSF_23550 [Pseudodesulfovibrio sediminis]|uniref:Uncharacterized protein n=1 Tax=Pseudodesulfovibrio sediminis TaxID=2810563 RepID=A0ABM8I4S6_9BACT|nr:hypothetical protein PSDVSF_23550 [Pseudodesulfovibrio sediminis]
MELGTGFIHPEMRHGIGGEDDNLDRYESGRSPTVVDEGLAHCLGRIVVGGPLFYHMGND